MSDNSNPQTVELSPGVDHAGVAVKFGSWLKTHCMLFPLLLLALDFYWVLWGNTAAVVFGIVLIAIICAYARLLKKPILPTIKRYWPLIVLLAIISLSMYVRMSGYFTPDGGTRWPYLRNIDSYFFLRHTETTVINGGDFPQHDNLILAPQGNEYRSPTLFTTRFFYVWLSYNAFTLVSLFSNMPLAYFMAWFAPLLASLVVIPAYFIGKYLFDRKAGIFAALFMVLSVPFLSRSLGGDPDSDAIVMLVMMLSVAAFLVMCKNMHKEKLFTPKNLLLSVLFGLSLVLFEFTWSGYWFTFWIVGAFIVFKIVADFLLHRSHKESHIRVVWKHTKNLVVLSLISLLVFELVVVPVGGIGLSTEFITAPMGAVVGGAFKGEAGQFPNVGVSIAEMQAGGDWKNVAIGAAGLDTAAGVSGLPQNLMLIISPFLLTLACFTYLLYSYVRRREHLDTVLFVGIWFVGFLFASIISVRFTSFLTPVYSICSGIILSKLWRIIVGDDRSLGA